MFSREAKTKIDQLFNLDGIDLDAEMNGSMAKVRMAEARRKRYYDRKLRSFQHEASLLVDAWELVLWNNHDQGIGKSKKPNRQWLYRVV